MRLLQYIPLSAVVWASGCLAQQAPLAYVCHYTARPIAIDGNLGKAVWKQASWTRDFIDITGDPTKKPVYHTRVKMLWDHKYLYIAAELQEPNVRGKLTAHDAVIFHDDDFEFFLRPIPESQPYFEYEINALNTTWDLYLNKPYRLGGKPDNTWESGAKTAVAVQGTLNNSTDRDQGWTVEVALPLDAFASRQTVPHPAEGTIWRMNFSRVEWLDGHPREENWVWTSQAVIDMHVPERWGYLWFRGAVHGNGPVQNRRSSILPQ